ncbi:hypothetical protein [Anabaena subtropica]|uniref:Uncharacterized protein n=1 Tax=Anabaena subtropica FACHB-260 TaxID=2692884 RepID=A0ABR8CR77_9NOST|nr:hypothetical protein [Anabaena subtropica]MBD2345439.1 hypothetical protein [Anabaena subtropica FACHB-260]
MAVSSGAGNHPLCVAGCRHRCQLTRGDRHRRTGGVCSVQASGLLHLRGAISAGCNTCVSGDRLRSIQA